ncbi:hypothetical protein SANTM175S_01487 [Streptomyces antimycoticus]
MGAGRRTEVVEDRAGLDDGGPPLGVERDDAAHMAGEVEDDAESGGLSCDRGPGAARDHRHPALPADGQHRRHIVRVPGRDHSVRHPSVVRRVHGHQGPARRIEGDVPADGPSQRLLQLVCLVISHASMVHAGRAVENVQFRFMAAAFLDRPYTGLTSRVNRMWTCRLTRWTHGRTAGADGLGFGRG